MNDEDDRRTLERQVAGLPVDADALAGAITRRAFDRTVVVEALLMGLDDPEPATRWVVAHRATRLVDLDPRVSARLAVMTDQDDDVGVREAAADALRAHGLPVPGEPAPTESSPDRATRPLAALRLLAEIARGETEMTIAPEDAAIKGPEGVLGSDGAGGAVLVLHGLPAAFCGHRPVLRAARERNQERFVVTTADAPVTETGHVIIHVPASIVPYEELVMRLGFGVDLEVPGVG